MTLDFDEGDELRALRAAVADLGSRYGQAYFLEQAALRRPHATRSGRRWARPASSASTCPRSTAAAAAGMVELVDRAARSSARPAARC